jgi:hypothetical protein
MRVSAPVSPNRLVAVALAIVATFVCSSSSSTMLIGNESPYELNASDIAVLDKVACRDPHRTSLETAEGLLHRARNYRSISAYVVCSSHERFKDKPMRFVVSCEQNGTRWECGEAALEMTVDVAGREVMLSLGGSEPAWAHDTIPEWLYVKCLGRVVTISTWCPQDECPSVVGAREATGLDVNGY